MDRGPRQARARQRPRRLAPKGPRVRLRWDRMGRVGLLIVLVFVAGLYIQHTLSYFSIRSQTDQQRAIVRRLSKENAALVRRERSLNDPATIRLDARRLGMVKASERPYVVTGLPDH